MPSSVLCIESHGTDDLSLVLSHGKAEDVRAVHFDPDTLRRMFPFAQFLLPEVQKDSIYDPQHHPSMHRIGSHAYIPFASSFWNHGSTRYRGTL